MRRLLPAIAFFASVALAQSPARAPIRQLGAIIAKAPITFDTLINVLSLSDGRIIVNDAVGHKLITLDATFTKVTVWSDTAGTTKQHMIDSVSTVLDSILASRPIPAGAPPGFKPTHLPVVSLAEIPDYYPPTRLGSMKLDFEGNLWIPPTTSRDARGGLLYDVVNRKGEVVERVQLPPGRAIAGFVPNGFVVLRSRAGNTVTIELARVR